MSPVCSLLLLVLTPGSDFQSHRPANGGPSINTWNPRRRSARRAHRTLRGSHLAMSFARKARLAARTAGLERLADRLHFFGFDEAALAGTASVVDSSAACVELRPSIEERYFSMTQPRSSVTGSDTWSQPPSRLTTCKSMPGEQNRIVGEETDA